MADKEIFKYWRNYLKKKHNIKVHKKPIYLNFNAGFNESVMMFSTNKSYSISIRRGIGYPYEVFDIYKIDIGKEIVTELIDNVCM